MASLIQRFAEEAAHALEDAYGNLVLGDDAGKSLTYVLVLHPQQRTTSSSNHTSSRLDLGMTFLEVNGRAYVRSVTPDSPAHRAGVQPRDAIQFACVFHPAPSKSHKDDWTIHNEEEDEDHDDEVGEEKKIATATEYKDGNASKYAMECEKRGMRVSYDELRRILAEGMDPTQSAFLSPPTTNHNSKHRNSPSRSWKPPPIPTTINICAPIRLDDEHNEDYQNRRPHSPFRGERPHPVVFVFRRTRQRVKSQFGLLPSFRLDDECDAARSLVQRLAPTADMELPPPDTWEELVHDGTDWLLGQGSILPPKTGATSTSLSTTPAAAAAAAAEATGATNKQLDDDSGIPLDEFEQERSRKMAKLRARMAAEAMHVGQNRTEDLEAATIRGMIQKAVGLAFVKASKVVLGVSLHAGSGIVIARLSDGTWSAPSAIGTWGLGLGLQFGLEVAEYIFILQTQESLDHFRRGGSFTIGGNVGAAVAGMGREAYGAASVGGMCGTDTTAYTSNREDEYNDNDSREENVKSSVGIAPIVAYAKSQGFYIGVSLEGSRIFTRNDINSRAYKFSSGRDVSAYDILSGKVPTPPEAEDLYAALHSVEFTHEMSCLPRPPEVLRKDSPNPWHYDKSTLGNQELSRNEEYPNQNRFNFLQTMSRKDAEECEAFETQFKKFMYGGVSVQRLLPHVVESSRTGRTRRERRTLWLMLPEVGSLRLGFVSKLSDGEGAAAAVSNKNSTLRASRGGNDEVGDLGTVASEEVTLDSAILDRDGERSTIGQIRTGNVELSSKHSVALTDVTVLSQDPLVPVRFNPDDKTEHLRVISVRDVSGSSLLFLANNFREAELLVCGLKLLLERESARLGVRGGLPITTLGGRAGEGAMSPAAARGFQDPRPASALKASSYGWHGRGNSRRRVSGYSSSELDDNESITTETSTSLVPNKARSAVPEGRKSWGQVPGRDYMRGQAAVSESMEGGGIQPTNDGFVKYVHGQLLVRDIAKNVQLPLPLPLCRVLLLDSTSPVISCWEKERGDTSFDKTEWTFPPATPRELEHHASEHQLIASGSMCGAHRTIAYDRPRNGTMVRLSETQIVDADDSEKLAFTISERLPRRGFSIKVRLLLRSYKESSCEATVLAEVRPVGKNMSNQVAVHKAFMLVLSEIKMRYGVENDGLLAVFQRVIDTMSQSNNQDPSSLAMSSSRPFPKTNPSSAADNNSKAKSGSSGRSKSNGHSNNNAPLPSSNAESGLVSFEDMLKTDRSSTEPSDRPATPSIHLQTRDPDPAKRLSSKSSSRKLKTDDFADFNNTDDSTSGEAKKAVMIEVKPLPKIRLSLMPPPREEDEENDSSQSPAPAAAVNKKKKSSSTSSSRRKQGSSSWRKSSKRI